ncbi:DUF5655 domain-containing protein [Glaciecola sp. 1036]|uniref:DUF5655 domain-containing protein n=1 Tax=Alteromonadaceae TaxID=72275 RepID=UPI003D051E3A
MEQNLLEKTGLSLAQWKVELAKLPFTKHGEYMKYLKSELGISHGYANFITLKFREADAGSSQDSELVSNQYKGKENLKPIFDLLTAKITELGSNVEVVPKKSAVSFRVKRQFALIQPSTKTRIDLGLKLNDVEHQGRLETSGPFGTMCTHRVQLTNLDQIDEQLLQWIKLAYTQAN